MEKDLDERLVPNGLYRHAMNVEVKTTTSESDGEGDSGTVQNIKGNSPVGFSIHADAGQTVKCVASIADEKSDKAYFFFTSGDLSDYYGGGSSGLLLANGTIRFIDNIVELDSTNNTIDPVLTDKWMVVQPFATAMGDNPTLPSTTDYWNQITLASGQINHYRVGMEIIISITGNSNVTPGAIIKSISGNTITLNDYYKVNITNGTNITARHDRILGFNKRSNYKITGINIIDDQLFWTDNQNEPKKINIRRCKSGTSGYDVHTRLKVDNPKTIGSLQTPSVLENDSSINNFLLEEHVTVIKKAPQTPPTVHITETASQAAIVLENYPLTSVAYSVSQANAAGYSTVGVSGGEELILEHVEFETANYAPNDMIMVQSNDNSSLKVRVKFLTYLVLDDTITTSSTTQSNTDVNFIPTTSPTGTIRVQVVEVNGGVPGDSDTSWTLQAEFVENAKPLFELKFPRFAYRYKYTDGEYSSFSPWSDIAFRPGSYNYETKSGYNLGMVNTIKELKIKDFIPYNTVRPLDVNAVDILLKTEDDSNVYVIKTITRKKDPEWVNFSGSIGTGTATDGKTGELVITSNMLHAAIPNDQTLRAWDNVPRYALAQEIIANRLVYANYTQGYNLINTPSLYTLISSKNIVSPTNPQPSVKSLRNYKLGIVFGDKYGRETPVLDSSIVSGNDSVGYKVTTGDVVSGKELSKFKNSLLVTQNWEGVAGSSDSEPESWMEYAKYYVKETSTEYYNLVMDRWYYAENEENIWLSFPSADRNKLDEETYLILKKEHGSDTPVGTTQGDGPARYKIIAIDNEAPDFIKTDRRTLSVIDLDPNDVVSGGDVANNEPTNLTTGTGGRPEIMISNTQLESLGFGGNPSPSLVKDLKFKIIATSNGVLLDTAPWVDVNSFSDSGGQTAVTFEKVLGQAVNYQQQFVNQFGTAAGIVYKMKIARDVVENKPEFDGRFFVLIEKDSEIDTYVAKLTDTSVGYRILFDFKLHYIANAKTNPSNGEPGSIGPDHTSYTWNGWGTFSEGTGTIGDGSVPPVYFMAHGYRTNNGELNVIEATEETHKFWKNASDPTQTSPMVDQRIFIDEAQARRLIWRDEFTVDPTVTSIIQTLEDNGYYERPGGLEQGGADPGTLGKITLSQASTSSPPDSDFMFQVPGSDSASGSAYWSVFATATGEGAYADGGYNSVLNAIANTINGDTVYFKFDNDPNDELYQIIVNDPVSGDNVQYRYTMHGTGRNYWGYDPDGLSSSSNTFKAYMSHPSTYDMPFQYYDDDGTGQGDAPAGTYGRWKFSSPSSGTFEQKHIQGVSNVSGGGWDVSDEIGRNSIQFEFRRIDKNTNTITSEGIDPTVYDPRATLKHDGMSNISVTFLKRDSISGDKERIPTDRAVWETEPKDNKDLDIYYEASHGIPLNLDRHNVFNFAPVNSIVSVKRELADGVSFFPDMNLIPTEDDGGQLPWSEYTTSRCFVKNIDPMAIGVTGPIIDVKSIDVNGNEVNQDMSIGVGDMIRFTHYNGTTTTSRVLSFRKSNGLPVDARQRTVTLSDAEDAAPNQVVLSTFQGNTESSTGGYLEPADAGFNIASGMQISGTAQFIDTDYSFGFINIPNGIFIYNYFGDRENMRLTDTSWMTPGVTYIVNIHQATGYYEIDRNVWRYPVELGWNNCYSFGNGVESDRVRDDFNATQLNNGVKASSTFLEYAEETRKSGLIYSGIYNSNSGVNRLNEFNMSQKITKDLNPAYGSIQRIKTRDLDLVTFLEDRVVKILANKDALFNADGNPQLTATDKVLGTAIPFVGDYGISKNPESLASDQYRLYFTDSQRGAVLRLSRDGLTPISNVGMKNWFRENISNNPPRLFGNFDIVNGEYNLTLNNSETISFNESAKGWVSFKSFIPDHAVSISGKYYTTNINEIYQHHVEDGGDESSNNRNTFYGEYRESELDVIFNDLPSVIKSFKSVNYEGSKSKVVVNTDSRDGNYYNLVSDNGWYTSGFYTDLEQGVVDEFIKKESKYFNMIKGLETSIVGGGLDYSDFTVQGIGFCKTDPVIDDPDDGENTDGNGNETNVELGPQTLVIQNDITD